MRNTTLVLICLILLSLLPACQEKSPLPEATATIEIVRLQITPSLTHWLTDVAACAEPIPNFGLVSAILPVSDLDLKKADLIMRLGERSEQDPFVAVLGSEALVIITGDDVPVTSISLESLQAIFNSGVDNWQTIPEMAAGGTEFNQSLTTLSYPEGHQLRQLFTDSYLQSDPITSDPLIFVTLEYLEALLQDYPAAVGYALKDQIPEGIKILPISGIETEAAQHPVLAVTAKQPQGALRLFLLCLQNAR